ncbi:Short-chain dehydrogenase reductase 3b [Platanthera zijinensis]|uniref:Short-chain dehydrogenase reductase 3b n=1 Tax=Platanthera zijinensis TaxID=2320716 RepID=A0AAP0B8T3_9ASPA
MNRIRGLHTSWDASAPAAKPDAGALFVGDLLTIFPFFGLKRGLEDPRASHGEASCTCSNIPSLASTRCAHISSNTGIVQLLFARKIGRKRKMISFIGDSIANLKVTGQYIYCTILFNDRCRLLCKKLRLEGKVTVITGGASEIEEADVRLFATKGVNVVIAGIRDTLNDVWEELTRSTTFMLNIFRKFTRFSRNLARKVSNFNIAFLLNDFLISSSPVPASSLSFLPDFCEHLWLHVLTLSLSTMGYASTFRTHVAQTTPIEQRSANTYGKKSAPHLLSLLLFNVEN